MGCGAFRELLHAYENREEAALRVKAAGGKVVGKLGCDVPDELLLAGGLFPVQVYADPDRPLTVTDEILEYAFDPVVRAQFEKLVDGTYCGLLDALAISNSTDVLIRVYLYLRELRRSEPERPVPETEFIDWLFTRNRLHQARNELVARLFWQTVERWAGRPVREEELLSAARVCNADKAALRRVQALRHQGRVSGCEALVIIGSGFFMDRTEHTALVNELADAAAVWPVIDAPRVFFTGSNQEDTSLYERIEDAGLLVVSEDHDWGARVYDRDFNMDYTPLRALADCVMLREFSSKKAFVSQRTAALLREVDACGAQGVVFCTNRYEQAASWDYPSQKQALEEKGIGTLGLFKLQWPCWKNEELEDAFADFAASLKGGADRG